MDIRKELKIKVSCWKQDISKNSYQLIFALILLILAIFIVYVSGSYTSEIKGPHIADLILDHFGPINLGIVFVAGYISIIGIFFIYPVLFKTSKIHVAITMFSLLIFTRSIFICLTHLITPPTAIYASFPWIFKYLRFTNDLFFSGHVAIPFLGFLIYKNKIVKYFMLVASITMAITVLLMHQHIFSTF